MLDCFDTHVQVYERAVGAIPNAVDLWVTYCSFKMNTCHDSEIIRR